MTRKDYLYMKVMEECAEVAHRASKAGCFGVDEIQSGQLLSNRERVMNEFHDLVAVMEMAGFNPRSLNHEQIVAKKQKVERYLLYSIEQGTVEPGSR